ncbi:MAG: hypothetical protein E5V74_05785 [Mesorhizobium sp.]|nr:MAG: hypothetical protein E5V74_05785 [Mesorhizobium sp.]
MSIDFLHEEKKAPRLRHAEGGWTMALRIRMPGGTLKVGGVLRDLVVRQARDPQQQSFRTLIRTA